ncbi:bladder cancer-associated protein [Culicoides brevitarsis]|uniref:bladder cancer-associated protein n=1 Tax=Culicoides brevitarsis TaxID=469753 RepID=UPI00307B3FFB
MYCLQALLPVLLIPKPQANPAMVQTHIFFVILFLVSFFLERKPCTICSIVFISACFLICYSGIFPHSVIGACLFWTNCSDSSCENE